MPSKKAGKCSGATPPPPAPSLPAPSFPDAHCRVEIESKGLWSLAQPVNCTFCSRLGLAVSLELSPRGHLGEESSVATGQRLVLSQTAVSLRRRPPPPKPSCRHPKPGHHSQEPSYSHPKLDHPALGHHSQEPSYSHPKLDHPSLGHHSQEPSYSHPKLDHPALGHHSQEPNYSHPKLDHPALGHHSQELSYGHPEQDHDSQEPSYGRPDSDYHSQEPSYGHPEPCHHSWKPSDGHSKSHHHQLLLGSHSLQPSHCSSMETKLVSQTEDDSKITIKIQLSSELHPNHPEWLRYYNVLFRRSMTLMDLNQNDPNLRDIRARLLASRFVPCTCSQESSPIMEIHQSYNTSILPYEDRLTLCADVIHRLHQKKTVYDLIAEKCENEVKNLKEEVSKEVLGTIVHTSYSNKTYRVDGIDWNQSPRNMFKKFDGTMITFMDYYRQKGLNCADFTKMLEEPLLVSMGRWRKGQTSMSSREPLFLIPQLCYLTGIASEVNKNHHLMSQLTDHMRMNPMNRRRALKKFMNDIQTNQTIQEAFLPWSVTFDDNCLSVSGRILNDGGFVDGYAEYKVDRNQNNWLRDSRNRALLRPKPLKSWVVLYTENCFNEVNKLMCNLREVTRDMQITMEMASM
ncbi:piwi 3 [Sigmodon hispidus]